jgi:hypothetical protein
MVSDEKQSERVVDKRRLRKGKLVEVSDAQVPILATLVVEDHIFALAGVTAPTEDMLKRPQDATGGGGRVTRKRSS